LALRLRGEKLLGIADGGAPTVQMVRAADAATESHVTDPDAQRRWIPVATVATPAGGPVSTPTVAMPNGSGGPAGSAQTAPGAAQTASAHGSAQTATAPGSAQTAAGATPTAAGSAPTTTAPGAGNTPAATRVESPSSAASQPTATANPMMSRLRRLFIIRETPPTAPPAPSTPGTPPTRILPRGEADQPGYHLYRPSSTDAPPDAGS
ncbi:MAG TPA: hypothetical protein VGF84_09910, partial [Micromonosporaceae bacterium]